MTALNLPISFAAWGGNPPVAVLAASSVVFWGLNTKNGVVYEYTVWRQLGDTEAARVPLPGPAGGQGVLIAQPNGQLWACVFTQAGDGSPVAAYAVPGYVSFPSRFDRFLAGLKALIAGI
jgi:hypothetical protein